MTTLQKLETDQYLQRIRDCYEAMQERTKSEIPLLGMTINVHAKIARMGMLDVFTIYFGEELAELGLVVKEGEE